MRLVVAEKPDAARAIAAAVGATEKGRGYLRGSGYVVAWAYGHLVEIAEPEDMNPSWGGKWSPEQLPLIPSSWKYRVRDDGREQFEALARLARSAEVHEVVCATDAGREGELIFRLIYEQIGIAKPVQRLWVSSLTREAVLAGLSKMKAAAAYDNLGAAARARAHADWVVGLTFTRAYTLKNGDLCTIGRVQTPTLALLVQRYREVKGFVPSSYWELHADLDPGFKAKLLSDGGQIAELGREDVGSMRAELGGIGSATVHRVDVRERREAPPALFDLLRLQEAANRKYGYTAAETLAAAQKLYERQFTTYPRTDCRHLSQDLVSGLADVVRALPEDLAEAKGGALDRLATGPALGKAYVDDSKLTDHHAIIPTNCRATGELSEREARVYRLVVERFLGIFQPDAVYDDASVLLLIGGRTFRANASVQKQAGWTRFAGREEPDEGEGSAEQPPAQLPPLVAGDEVPVRELLGVEKQRQPPRLYTDGSLLKAMEGYGLGRPATWPDIIERLIRSVYLRRERRSLVPTEKGVALIDQVEPDLKDVGTTAQWEGRLEAIAEGRLASEAFAAGIAEHVRQLLPRVHASTAIRVASALKCPACKDGDIQETAKAWGCTRWKQGCKFAVWKEQWGKRLTPQQAEELIVRRRTRTLQGFKSKKTGAKFAAALVLDQSCAVKLEFNR